MRKSTAAIVLTLIGSGLIVSVWPGCDSQSDNDTAPTPASGSSHWHHGGGGGYYYGGRSWFSSPSAGGRSAPGRSASAVSRGGFGGAGHAAGGS
jgi:hypothetical protein